EEAPNPKQQAPDVGIPGGVHSSRSARPVYKLTAEQRARATAAFERVLDEAVLPYEVGQLGLWSDEDETFIRREVERLLYEPKLANGGDKERSMIERLEKLPAKADPDWAHAGGCRP